MDKGLLRDAIVGIFDIDLFQVYFKKEHAIQNQWVAFGSESDSEIKGILQISIAIQGPDDKAIVLEEAQGLENSEDAEVLMPASIRKAYKQMNISILRAEHLPKMDIGIMGGSIDAYVETTFMKHKYKTKIVEPNKLKQCIWNEQFKMPLQWPISNDRFVLGIWDDDKIDDEKVGSIVLSIKELAENCSKKGGDVRWVNIYGAPTGLIEGPNMKKMNNNPE